MRGCPAASLTSGISACWMSVCLAALGGPGTSRRGTPSASRLPVCVPTGIPCPWLRGYREVFHLSAVEHILSSVSGGGACACPPVRLPPRSGEIRMSAFPQAVCPLNRVACFSGRRVSGGCPAVRQPGEIPAATNRVPGGQSFPQPGHVASRGRVGARHSFSLSGSLSLRLSVISIILPSQSVFSFDSRISARRPLSILSSLSTRLGDFGCLRSLRHPVLVVAWLRGGVSAFGSRAFPFVGFHAVGKSGCLPASRQSVPSAARAVFRVVGFGRLSGCPAAWRNSDGN